MGQEHPTRSLFLAPLPTTLDFSIFLLASLPFLDSLSHRHLDCGLPLSICSIEMLKHHPVGGCILIASGEQGSNFSVIRFCFIYIHLLYVFLTIQGSTTGFSCLHTHTSDRILLSTPFLHNYSTQQACLNR